MQQLKDTSATFSSMANSSISVQCPTLCSVDMAQSLMLSFSEACFRNLKSHWNHQIKTTAIKLP